MVKETLLVRVNSVVEGDKLHISADFGKERARILEEYIKLRLQPKPRWMLPILWKWAIKHLLVLEITK